MIFCDGCQKIEQVIIITCKSCFIITLRDLLMVDNDYECRAYAKNWPRLMNNGCSCSRRHLGGGGFHHLANRDAAEKEGRPTKPRAELAGHCWGAKRCPEPLVNPSPKSGGRRSGEWFAEIGSWDYGMILEWLWNDCMEWLQYWMIMEWLIME